MKTKNTVSNLVTIGENFSMSFAQPKSYATISNTGEIVITGTEEEIRQCIENSQHADRASAYLVLEIMRLRQLLTTDKTIERQQNGLVRIANDFVEYLNDCGDEARAKDYRRWLTRIIGQNNDDLKTLNGAETHSA